MFTVCIVGLVILLFINILVRNEYIIPTNYMILFWLFSILLNKYSFIDYFEVSDKTYSMILLGVAFFFVGGLIYHNLSEKISVKQYTKTYEGRCMNKSVLGAYVVVHLLTTLYFAIKMVMLSINGFSFNSLRSIYQGYEEGVVFLENRVEELAFNWIQWPLQQILPIILVVILFQRKQVYNKYILFIVIDEVIYFLYTQSRSAIFYILIYVFIINVFYKNIISLKIRRLMNFISVTIIFLILALTIIRFSTSNRWSGLRSLVLYGGGSVSMLNEGIKTFDSMNFDSYGVQFVYGWYVIFMDVLYNFMGVRMSQFASTLRDIEAYKEIYIRIGPNVWFNAYYSFFFDFYIALKEWGVAIGSVIFGITSELRINRMKRNPYSEEALCYGLLTCIVLFASLARWQFVSPPFCFAYIYLFILFRFNYSFKIGTDHEF